MIEIVFRDWVDDPNPIAGKGTLDIPKGESINQRIGSLVPFTITAEYADLPLGPSSKGVVAAAGSQEYYEFEVVEINKDRSSGHLRVVSRAKRGSMRGRSAQ
jgi:hypothetical protein